MAYREGESRTQIVLFPESLDEYVSSQHPVRAFDAFVDHLNFQALGILEEENRVGNPEYHPRLMLKLLVYGYSYGIRSSRKLEREVHHNVSFMWLMKNLRPDHKTIAEFRRQHKKALHEALRLCAQLCLKLKLIDGNVLFVDGTKIRANANRQHSHEKDWYQQLLQELDQRIQTLLQECEQADAEEANQGSWVKMQEELSSTEVLKDKVLAALQEFAPEQSTYSNGKPKVPKVNLTDPESSVMKSLQGSHASYNVQMVVDDQQGLIVQMNAMKQGTDIGQFATQIQAAEETLEKPCQVGCADAGYANTEVLMQVQSEQTTVVVPSMRQALHQEEKPFSKSAFRYDKEKDCYYCPQGHSLPFLKVKKAGKKLGYRIRDAKICHGCIHYGICTKAKDGRTITRLVQEEAKEQLEHQYVENQTIYKRRKTKVELPFGHLKRNLGITQFLLRGKAGVLAELSLGAICFNMVRMMTLLGGTTGFIQALQKI